MLWITSWPRDFTLTRSIKSRTTLKLTSASSRASRTSRRESLILSSEILPRPRRFRNAFCSLPLIVSNMRLKYPQLERCKAQFAPTCGLSGETSDYGIKPHGLEGWAKRPKIGRELSDRVVSFCVNPSPVSRLVGYPSGQRGQTVNLLAYAFAGSNPAPTTTFPDQSLSRSARGAQLKIGQFSICNSAT